MKKKLCKICKKFIKFSEYFYHIKKYHDLSTTEEKKWPPIEIIDILINNTYIKTDTIRCELCKNKNPIKMSKLLEHLENVHNLEIEEKTMAIDKMSRADKKKYLDRLLFPDEKQPVGEDVFDKKGVVVSGGGFGVGKKKKG